MRPARSSLVAGIDHPSATSVKAIVASARTRSTQKIYEELIDRARGRISAPV